MEVPAGGSEPRSREHLRERGDESIDLVARPLLGDGDDQRATVRRRRAAPRPGTRGRRARRGPRSPARGSRDGELLEERRRRVEQVDARRPRSAARRRTRPSTRTAAPARRARPGPAIRGRPWRRSPSASGSCRCWSSPSRDGCAVRAPAASARSRSCRRRRPSPRRSGRACGGRRPAARRSGRGTGRRSSGGCRAPGPSATAMSAPSSPGGARTPSESGSNTWIARAPPSWARPNRSRTGSRMPYTFGCCTMTAATSGPTSGSPPRPSVDGERPRVRTPLPCRTRGACRRAGDRRLPRRGPGRVRGPAPCSRPRPARSPRRTARRSRPRARSARRSSTGTRTASGARPARAPAGTACTRCRTPSDPPVPTRRSGCSGRRRRRRRSTPARRRLRFRAASARMSATSSISETPSGMSSGRSSRTSPGSRRTARRRSRARASRASRSTSSSVCGANLTAPKSTVSRSLRVVGSGLTRRILQAVLRHQRQVVALVEDLAPDLGVPLAEAADLPVLLRDELLVERRDLDVEVVDREVEVGREPLQRRCRPRPSRCRTTSARTPIRSRRSPGAARTGARWRGRSPTVSLLRSSSGPVGSALTRLRLPPDRPSALPGSPRGRPTPCPLRSRTPPGPC